MTDKQNMDEENEETTVIIEEPPVKGKRRPANSKRPSKSKLKAAVPPNVTKGTRLTKRTQLQMMEDRGYIVAPEEWAAVHSVDQFKIVVDAHYLKKDPYNPFYMIYEPIAGSRRKRTVVAYIPPPTPNTTDRLRHDAVIAATRGEVSSIIFIYLPSKSNKRRLVSEIGLSYEEFEAETLEINAYRSRLSDKITPLTSTERDALCLQERLTTAELSGISSDDSAIRYLGILPHTVVRIDIENSLNFYMKTSVHYCEVRNIPILYTATDSTLGDEGGDPEDPDDDDDEAPEEFVGIDNDNTVLPLV